MFPIQYDNGNYTVKLHEDGTKERLTYDTFLEASFPESIDLKITNRCDLGCPYCYENSVKKGKHANLDKVFNNLSSLPPGVEIAIGGGNPFIHPKLIPFLRLLKQQGLIANITINAKHINYFEDALDLLSIYRLLYGIGVSYDGKHWYDSPNTVYHMIAGIHTWREIYKVIKQNRKVLILGYKLFGRGRKFHNNETIENIQLLKENLWKFLGTGIVSFDNLAIEQLEVKTHFTKEGWNKFYMGDDGKFTMYYDGVKQEYATSSISKNRIKAKKNVVKVFKKL